MSYKSNWEFCKERSSYHFDSNIKDKHGEWFQVLGKFTVDWQQDLEYIYNLSKPMTWANRKFTMGRKEVSAMLDQEEYDILQGGGDPRMELVNSFDDFSQLPAIQRIIDFFGLERNKSRVHVQRTGQVFNNHIDKLDAMYPNDDPKDIVKFCVMLKDWEPGHFYQYGNLTYEHWHAGECHIFDWYNIPHCTANASNNARYTLHITGIKTAHTDQIINGKIPLN